MRLRAALALATALLAAGSAWAQVLYKWTDASGQVVYSDRPPPKGYTGKVERIEPDEPITPAAAPRVAAPTAKADPLAPAPAPDLASKRRSVREQLQARVDAAREKVEAARKALEGGAEASENDRRIVQQRVSSAANPSIALRLNCRSEHGADGKDTVICPTSILNQEYLERQDKLAEDLREAEAALAEAREAYRRGVD